MNKRLEYLDCLRGIVMLMVIFCHTCSDFCLGYKESFWISRIFSFIMLPGFFFISGWFTKYNIRWELITKRFKSIIIPTFLTFFIYIYLYWGNIDKIR